MLADIWYTMPVIAVIGAPTHRLAGSLYFKRYSLKKPALGEEPALGHSPAFPLHLQPACLHWEASWGLQMF